MQTKKVLYITTSLFRNESASLRNISLINGIIENNHTVDVITLEYNPQLEDSFLINNINKKIKIKKIKIPNFNKIISKISHIRKSNTNKKNNIITLKIKDYIKQFLFFPDVLSESIKNSQEIKIEQEYDYIISSSDSKSSHFIAQKIIEHNQLDIPWIQIWGDPWISDIGLNKTNFIIKQRVKYNEKKLLEKSNKIFYISELTLQEMKLKFPKLQNKMNSLYRSYFKEIISNNDRNENNKKIIFSYTGTISNRNIDDLVNSIKKYNLHNPIKIELQLYGIDSSLDDKNNSDFIKIFPRISFEKVLEVYNHSDVLVYIDNKGNSSQIPGKIYDYFGTNKVILGLYENNNTKNFLEKFNRIELYPNNEKFINLDKVIKEIGKKQPLQQFSSKNVAKDFMNKIGEK